MKLKLKFSINGEVGLNGEYNENSSGVYPSDGLKAKEDVMSLLNSAIASVGAYAHTSYRIKTSHHSFISMGVNKKFPFATVDCEFVDSDLNES